MLRQPGHVLIWFDDAGADPDPLFHLRELGHADSQELGIPANLIYKLHTYGLLSRHGGASFAGGRRSWVPGPVYGFWYEHYKERRNEFRAARNMSLDIDPKILTRIIIRAGCDPDDLLDFSAYNVELQDMKAQARALVSIGILRFDPGSRCFVTGKNYDEWAKAYPYHRDELRRIYRLRKRPVPVGCDPVIIPA